MKKKHIYILSAVIAVVIIVAAVLFLWSRRRVIHGSAIPKDAVAIARLDILHLFDKADFTLEEKLQLMRRYMSDADDETDLGIDLKKPIYGFATKDGNFGAVAALSDDDDFEDFCEELQERGLASEMTRQRGFSWAVVARQWLLCFDDDRALVMGPAIGADQDRLRGQMAELMKQNPLQSAIHTELFHRLDGNVEPLSAVADAALLPLEWRGQISEMLGLETLDDIYLRLAADANRNELVFHIDLLTDQAEASQHLKEIAKTLRPIDGRLIERAQPSGLMWLMCNVQGSTLIEFLRKNPDLRTALLGMNMMVDADQMLTAVDGDVMLELTDVTFLLGWSRTPSLRLLAELKDMDFLQQKDYWLKSAAAQSGYKLTESSPQDFCLMANGYSAWFGAHDNILYVAASQNLATTERVPQENAYLRSERQQIKNYRLYLTLDTQPIAALSRLFGQGQTLGMFRLFKRLNVTMKEVGQFEIQLVAPEDTNLTKKLLLR